MKRTLAAAALLAALAATPAAASVDCQPLGSNSISCSSWDLQTSQYYSFTCDHSGGYNRGEWSCTQLSPYYAHWTVNDR